MLKQKQKRISMALKILIIFSAILGTVLSAYGGSNAFMGGKTVLMYFTIQSNLAIALICAVGLYFIYMEKEISGVWAVIKLIGTVSITLSQEDHIRFQLL